MEPASADWGNLLSTVNESDATFQEDFDTMTITFLTTSFLTVILAPLGLAGNAVVVWLLGCRLRRNPFSVYILHLAVADCLVLGIVGAFCLLDLTYFFLGENIEFLLRINHVVVFPYLMDMSLLSAIGTERCLSILCPLWYRCRRPSYMSAVMCTLLWALSLMLAILDWVYCSGINSDMERDWCTSFEFIIAMWVIFLFVVLCGSSLVLLVKVFYGSRRRNMTRLIVTILITVLVCLLCGLPFGISWFTLTWMDMDLGTFSYFCSRFLSCVNSSANPIIYFFVGSFRQRQRVRPTLRMVLQRALQDTPEGEEPGGAPPQGPTEQAESSAV
ncbi:mas-related G-protein coupled receptor member X1-like [Echinops telfairi]|uniref:Mas-related G-protein coupled receptor member X1-like n=1 Tax=Echinops telfairi TaxID=9371 RepID=A0ABM0IZU3_ECHTE|nr:mas-related G-protein coupled receptor member X1-like [Echinops telfairi]